MKIAVIGSGIAGNVAAHHLAEEHSVTVFEAGDHLGGHTHTHDIEWDGRHYAVDSGFIVFNERTYPNFIRLLQKLGVASQPTEMSFSIKCDATGLEYNGHSLNSLFAQRRNLLSPSFHRMVRDILRFNREAPGTLDRGEAEMPLGDYLAIETEERELRVPYILMVTGAGEMLRVVPDAVILDHCHRNLGRWDALQEACGIDNSHALALLESERAGMAEQRDTAIEEARQHYQQQLQQDVGALSRQIVSRI
ncbi:MAG: FAD-dependent oxidoreductase, partial [Sedimenticolaceae bacterium]|nr:FAD-dependent oxidoreductase [Sedimenticolaceae bacterium]